MTCGAMKPEEWIERVTVALADGALQEHVFTVGEQVQVWSQGRNAWLDGSVDKVALEFSGTWKIGDKTRKIDGTILMWTDGEQVPLEIIVDRRFKMDWLGTAQTATLGDDDSLHWDDGDIWTREVADRLMDGYAVPAGTLKVKFQDSEGNEGEKYVKPQEVATVIRAIVEEPTPDQHFCHCKHCKRQWSVPPGPPTDDGRCVNCPAKVEDGRLEGTAWSKGIINGDLLTWNNGVETRLQITDGPKFTMLFKGTEYTAAVGEDGKLHWNDGAAWIKVKEVDIGSLGELSQDLFPVIVFYRSKYVNLDQQTLK